MKKTATLFNYPMMYTKGGICIEVRYRGRLLTDFYGPISDFEKLELTAKQWAWRQGFTHTVRKAATT